MTRELDFQAARRSLDAVLESWMARHDRFRALEAGGGSMSHLDLHGAADLTVIDISAEQLARNTTAARKVLGDLHTYEFEPGSFDLICCWDVVEHLDDPGRVVASFARWIRPDGLILIAAPNPTSLSGLVTRLTPHWVHVFVYRHLFRNPDAGRPGGPPFRTHMRREMFPSRLARALEREGLDVRLLRPYESERYGEWLPRHAPWLRALFVAAVTAGRALTLGRWRPDHSDFFLVAHKPARVTART